MKHSKPVEELLLALSDTSLDSEKLKELVDNAQSISAYENEWRQYSVKKTLSVFMQSQDLEDISHSSQLHKLQEINENMHDPELNWAEIEDELVEAGAEPQWNEVKSHNEILLKYRELEREAEDLLEFAKHDRAGLKKYNDIISKANALAWALNLSRI